MLENVDDITSLDEAQGYNSPNHLNWWQAATHLECCQGLITLHKGILSCIELSQIHGYIAWEQLVIFKISDFMQREDHAHLPNMSVHSQG